MGLRAFFANKIKFHKQLLFNNIIIVLMCKIFATVLSRNKEDNPEFSLSEGGDEARTEQALQEAFDQATGQQNQQTGGGQGPGMSLLQDSVLGMQPNGKYRIARNIGRNSIWRLSPKSLLKEY